MKIKIECAHDKIVSLDKLKPHPANPNKHPEAQIALLAKIIKAQGWRNPIVVSNRSGFITKGHARLEAAKLIGTKVAPVDFQNYSSEKKELADIIADNRIAELAEADRSMLRELAEQLDDGEFDMDLTGFDHDALEELMTAAPPESDLDAEPHIDKADELRKKWNVEPGQIWQLENHRIMCGDSSSVKDLSRLVNKSGIDLIVTSPPYNVGINYNSHDDSELSWDGYRDFLSGCLKATVPLLYEGRAVAWNIGVSRKTHHIQQHLLLEDHGLDYLRQIIWKKVGVPVPLAYHMSKNPVARNFTPNYQHELILIFTKGKLEHGSQIELDPLCEHDVFEYAQNMATVDLPSGKQRSGVANSLDRRSFKAHPAAFPTRIPRMFISQLTGKNESVLEPFSGSGSTIIACEQTQRSGFGMEIDPGYAAVSIQRWADATGKTPQLLE